MMFLIGVSSLATDNLTHKAGTFDKTIFNRKQVNVNSGKRSRNILHLMQMKIAIAQSDTTIPFMIYEGDGS